MANPRQYIAKVTFWKNGKILIDPIEDDKKISHKIESKKKKRKE